MCQPFRGNIFNPQNREIKCEVTRILWSHYDSAREEDKLKCNNVRSSVIRDCLFDMYFQFIRNYNNYSSKLN